MIGLAHNDRRKPGSRESHLARPMTSCDSVADPKNGSRAEDGMAKRKKGAVGVVGLGIMGGSFARNLVESGWRVLVYDTDPKLRRALAKPGMEFPPDVAAL